MHMCTLIHMYRQGWLHNCRAQCKTENAKPVVQKRGWGEGVGAPFSFIHSLSWHEKVIFICYLVLGSLEHRDTCGSMLTLQVFVYLTYNPNPPWLCQGPYQEWTVAAITGWENSLRTSACMWSRVHASLPHRTSLNTQLQR